MSVPMKRYRKLPVQVEACQFTRDMAEGLDSLPEGVDFHGRELDEENMLLSHDHRIGKASVDVGQWIVKQPSGRIQILNPDVFESVYKQMRESSAEGTASLVHSQYTTQLVSKLKDIGIEPENESHRQEILETVDEFISWTMRMKLAEAAMGGVG